MNIKRILFAFATAVITVLTAGAAVTGDITPVPFTNVHITDRFWAQRLSVMRRTTIRYALKKVEDAGQIRNFEYAGRIVSGKAKVGDLKFQSENPYDDAEVYKVLEGAAYLLTVEKDPWLEAKCDSIISLICSAQEPDGYLQTNYTIHNPLHPWYNGEKWKSDWNLSHETFNIGELIESAIAYYQATGKDRYLRCARRAADNLCSVFGRDGLKMAPGHAVIEMALVRLYELTRDEKYLNECKFFLDCRGLRKFDPASPDMRVNGKYWQDHLPATGQRSAEGHAVRAMYFYSGMADWVRYSGDRDYETAVTAIWNNIAGKKFYITGGFGARDENEAFGENYELPNAGAYCETCASVAGTMFCERMFRLHGKARYIDMLERALYNTVLDGTSIHGTTFYYPNRLEVSERGNERSEWFGTSCCPTNLCRLIPSVPGYVYAVSDRSLYLNLFISSTATMSVGRYDLTVRQSTGYPYDGDVKVKVSFRNNGKRGPQMKDLRIRIPGWAQNRPVDSDLYSYANPTTTPVTIRVAGKSYAYSTADGYAVLPLSVVKKGEIEISLPMDIHQVKAIDSVAADRGLRSYERGPLVYCAEGVDNGGLPDGICIPEGARYETTTMLPELFDGGVTAIMASGIMCGGSNGTMTKTGCSVRLIPYFARAHRGASAMKVWIPVDASAIAAPIAWIDKVQPTDEANEKAHHLTGSNMRTGTELGWRDSNGGYIGYTMKVLPDKPVDVVLKLWGSDNGNRRFYITVDGRRIAQEVVENCAPGQYYYARHAIPAELSRGKQSVTVKLESDNGSLVGGLFGLYTTIGGSTQP